MSASSGGGGDVRPEQLRVTFFKMDDSLNKVWAQYVEQNEEKHFRKFVAGIVQQWEKQVCPNWNLMVIGRLQGHREEGPCLSDLPDELLVAASKFLFITKDEAEQGEVNGKSVAHAKDIVKCLTILCRQCDNIPLVSSMDFVSLVTQIDSLLLRHLLEMESAFFGRGKVCQNLKNIFIMLCIFKPFLLIFQVAAEMATQKLRKEIDDFIVQSCHLLESIYDPFLRWRSFMSGKGSDGNETTTPEDELPPTPVALHQVNLFLEYVRTSTGTKSKGVFFGQRIFFKKKILHYNR